MSSIQETRVRQAVTAGYAIGTLVVFRLSVAWFMLVILNALSFGALGMFVGVTLFGEGVKALVVTVVGYIATIGTLHVGGM